MAEKFGLLFSFEKTEYMLNQKDAPEKIITKYGDIERVHEFKYLGEVIQSNGLEKEAHKQRS